VRGVGGGIPPPSSTSSGWLGAVAGFLALALTGFLSEDAHTVRAACLAMDSTGRFVLIPLALASLLTGLVPSLGTKWGLFHHWWVVVKLVITVVATVVLLLDLQTLSYLADVAAETTVSSGGISRLRDPSPALHAGVALLLLLTTATLGPTSRGA
jgi:hypothetical protein